MITTMRKMFTRIFGYYDVLGWARADGAVQRLRDICS